MQNMEQSSCTEDRIQHALERCLCDLGQDTPDKCLWNASLCINRWCLEELVKRDANNFLILLQKVLRKTKQVLEQSRYELVVPLTLLFSSALLRAPCVSLDFDMLQEAYFLFHAFLTWPEPCFSACKRLLNIIQQELRAPGISFQRLVKAEQGVSREMHCSKSIMVLLVNPDEADPPEIQKLSRQLSNTQLTNKDITIILIMHCFQTTLSTRHDWHALHNTLQAKQPEELEKIMETVTEIMDTAAATADLSGARQSLVYSMESLRENLAVPVIPDGSQDTGAIEPFPLPFPKCYTCFWENDNFDFLNNILSTESSSHSNDDCFLKMELDEDNNNDICVDEEDEALGNKAVHLISTASSSSRDSRNSLSASWSAVSTPSGSSGVESDFNEDTAQEDAKGGCNSQCNSHLKPRKKPKKKSRSLLGVERLSLLFKVPVSPNISRRFQSTGHHGYSKDPQKTGSNYRQVDPLDSLSPQMCIRRRPILSCDEGSVEDTLTLVKVVVFGGDREVGRLARAYYHLQQKESKCPRLTKMCKLQFYFVPTKRRTARNSAGGHMLTERETGSSSKAAASGDSNISEEITTDIAQMLGGIDPWFERNVLGLLSLPPHILCQATCKERDDASFSSERLPLLADVVLYYCRHADQPVLLQLYQAELTLAGGERRTEVFIHSLELGHTAGTRAVKAMGAASKRFGIDEEREAVPLALSVAYNKVTVSGRSQWNQTDTVCTSINLNKACRKPEQLVSITETLQLSITEVLKRQCSKAKKGYNQHISITETKVDKVQVISSNEETFAVCLDQDEKKFIQSVTRCNVSLCCKPGGTSDWRSYKPLPGQVQPLCPSYCSLLCFPINTFSASCP